MKENCFIYFDILVINELLKTREFQTSEFQLSKDFNECLFTEADSWMNINNIAIVKHENATYCFRKDMKENKGILIDLDQLSEIRKKDISERLSIVMKVLRFATKYWNNHPMTNSELRIQDTTTYCIIPLPFVVNNYYKILIETKPDSRRLEKRNIDCLICYKDGYNKPLVSDPSLTNLRKALDSVEFAFSKMSSEIKTGNESTFGSYQIADEKKHTEIKGFIGYESWKSFLTDTQKKFIYNKNLTTSRIEGPAGSGKTLSLILRAMFLLKKFYIENEQFRLIFITHSTATKDNIKNIISNEMNSSIFDRYASLVSINVTTLLEWCIENGNMRISLNDCLEPDALDSKQMQILYIEEIYKQFHSNEYISTYQHLISKPLKDYIESIDSYLLYDNLQKEFSIFIKGQANQDIEKYKNLAKSVFPVKTTDDRGFLFRIFDQYQRKLEQINQFDVDDVILSAMGSLNTPIWKRIRNTQGYDYIILDETQLFNFNELSILQYINKEDCRDHISFSQDVSQSAGDIGFGSTTFEEIGDLAVSEDDTYNFETVFRCSQEIAEVAFKILTSSPTLLTNVRNPMHQINIVSNDPSSIIHPYYFEHKNDSEMIDFIYQRIDKLVKKFHIARSDMLIVATDHLLLSEIEKYGKIHNKPIQFIEKRGDKTVLDNARNNGLYVGSMIDFVGGLEFDAVIILGVDGVRVPPNSDKATHFQQQAWVNKMYVAVTRARKLLELNANISNLRSPIIESALSSETITKMET
jgi:superfamily I DNA/RNA helicase